MTVLTSSPRYVGYPSTPLASLLNLTRDLDRILESGGHTRDSHPAFSPVIEIRENHDRVLVLVEIPGIDRSAVSVTFHDGVLTISGERKPEPAAEGEVVRTERSHGRFERQVTLALSVDGDKISAAFKDGVLIVTIPKSPEAKPKTIEVVTH